MKKTAALFCILLLLCPYVAADGMIFIEDRDMWQLQPEANQLAAINYENGIENLLIFGVCRQKFFRPAGSLDLPGTFITG